MSVESLGFSSETLPVRRLFSDPFILITPGFQRPCSWQRLEAAQLLNDLAEALDLRASASMRRSGYFLGSILLVAEDDDGGYPLPSEGTRREFQVIDGLQRLVTLTILLCVLRDLDDSPTRELASRIEEFISIPGSSRKMRLTLHGSDAGFLHEMVQRPGSVAGMPDDADLGQGELSILEMREYFAGELIEMPDAERQRLADFILDNCAVTVNVTSNIDCAFRMFAALNGRGRPLEGSDIIKAEVIGSVAAGEAERCAAQWHVAKNALGDNFEQLFSHIRVIHRQQNVPIITGIRNIIRDAGTGGAFVADVLEPMAEVYRFVLCGDLSAAGIEADGRTGARIQRALRHLHWLNGTEWVPLALSWISCNRHRPARIASFLEALEIHSYCLRVLGLGRQKRSTRFAAVLNWIEAGQDQSVSDAPMALSSDEERLVIRNLRNLYNRNQQVCKIVLLRLSNELADGEEQFEPSQFTVEHVLPRKSPLGGQWRQWFDDADVREKSLAGLGNLVLVTKKQNEKAGSGEFAHKLNVYFNMPDEPMTRLTNELRDATSWMPSQVLERDQMLMGLLKSMWGIEVAAPAA